MTDADSQRAANTRHATNEVLRKTLHIFFGLFAFSLRLLTWPVAAAVAACAVLCNWLVLHRLVGARVSRDARGWDAGIVLYPLAVLALIIIFRSRIEIAGAVWAILAFGDGFATIAGRSIGGPRLPWNGNKSWSGLVAFVAFGFVAGETAWLWLRTSNTAFGTFGIVLTTVLVCAVVESLPLNVNDNVTVPAAGAASMALLTAVAFIPVPAVDQTAMAWLAANTILALVGFALRSVDLSGLIAGWILGAAILLFGGWQLYVVLLAFFIIGTATTRLGYRRKATAGLAQEKGGRRGASHAFSNTGVAAILAIASAAIPQQSTLLWFAAAAALATAAADTTASEIGQMIGRRAFLPLTFRRVPTGTEGAISIEGTLAALTAAALVACVTSLAYVGHLHLRPVATVAIAAFAGSYIESIAGSFNRKRNDPVPNGALNFFNTAVGALLLIVLLKPF